jgi:hypothetical protein
MNCSIGERREEPMRSGRQIIVCYRFGSEMGRARVDDRG